MRVLFITLVIFILTACFQQDQIYQGYVEGEYINLSSNASGILKQLGVARGEQVKKDQLMYMLDQEPEAANLKIAMDDLVQAQRVLQDLEVGQRDTIIASLQAKKAQADADFAFASSDLVRYKALYEKGYVGKAMLDAKQAAYDIKLNLVNQFMADLQEASKGARDYQIQASLAKIASQEARFEAARWALSQKTVYAPKDAMVFDTFFEEGEFVNLQQPVLALLAPDDIKIVFFVPEPKRSKVAIGQIVHFDCDGCQSRTKATINYISPDAEYTPPVIFSRESREKLVYRVEAALSLKDAKRFHPGQPIDVYPHGQ